MSNVRGEGDDRSARARVSRIVNDDARQPVNATSCAMAKWYHVYRLNLVYGLTITTIAHFFNVHATGLADSHFSNRIVVDNLQFSTIDNSDRKSELENFSSLKCSFDGKLGFSARSRSQIPSGQLDSLKFRSSESPSPIADIPFDTSIVRAVNARR